MPGDRAYSVADYGAMIFDTVRLDAYLRALKQAMKPDAVVIDIGTGIGIFALLACRLGARRVYAIEPEDVIQVAREIAAANGCADRIEFIQAMSTQATLPERADVIISDLTGALPWFRQHIPSIVDARRRLLAPGGVFIPKRDVAWAAVVDVRNLYARWTGPWNHQLGLDMEAARRIVTNTSTRIDVTPDNLLTEPERWGPVDYAMVEDPGVQATITWTVTQPGMGHGLAAGFDRTLSDGVCISNAPNASATVRPAIYPTIFFPWPAPIELVPGDVVIVDLAARLVRRDYIWNWKTRVLDQPRAIEKASFEQSTFHGVPLSPATLRKRGADDAPTLNEDGRIARLVLDSMNDGLPLGDIARRLSVEFSTRFVGVQDALAHVVELSRLYA